MTELCVSKKVDTENFVRIKDLGPGVYTGRLNSSCVNELTGIIDCRTQHIVFITGGTPTVAYSLLNENAVITVPADKLYNHRPVKITQIKVQEI